MTHARGRRRSGELHQPIAPTARQVVELWLAGHDTLASVLADEKPGAAELHGTRGPLRPSLEDVSRRGSRLGRDGGVSTAATTWRVPAPRARWGQWLALGGLRAVSIGALRDADGASVVVAAGQDGRLHAASARAGRHGEADRRSGAGDLRWTRASSMASACGERRVLVLGSDGRVSTKVSRGGAWGGWAAVGAQRFATGASLAALDTPGEWFLSLPAHCFAEAE